MEFLKMKDDFYGGFLRVFHSYCIDINGMKYNFL